MIRPLILIAVTGFLVSVVTLSIAVGIAGPEAIARGAWSWAPAGHWGSHLSWSDSEGRDAGPQASREIAWSGGDKLEVDVPADITYTQAAGPAKLTVTGPKSMVDAVELKDGRLRFDSEGGWRHGHRHWGQLTVVMTAPAVTQFELNGANKLAIADYRQDKLGLDLSGDSEVSVKGEAKSLDLRISGSADTDLSDLKLQDAQVDISGSGDATLAPLASANLNISGSGDVTLLTHPAQLESHVSGSGSVRQAERAMPDTPAPAAKTPKARPGRT